jgi:transcriptional regulator with XRE-family HTH domain
MKDRVTALRKALKLSQVEFAKRLGMRNTSLSSIEVGDNILTEKNIKLICVLFNVNEDWLRSGEGEMFKASSSPYETEFFDIYNGLLPETQQALLQFARELLASQRKLMGKDPPDTSSNSKFQA